MGAAGEGLYRCRDGVGQCLGLSVWNGGCGAGFRLAVRAWLATGSPRNGTFEPYSSVRVEVASRLDKLGLPEFSQGLGNIKYLDPQNLKQCPGTSQPAGLICPTASQSPKPSIEHLTVIAT